MRLMLLAAAALTLAGCKCGAPSDTTLGPLAETKPGDLGPDGFLIEQPAAAESIAGSWVSVTGWLDPARYNWVAVVGAPADGFYEATGHVGIPTVPVSVRADGRFVAQRVPLAKGPTTLTLIAFQGDTATLTRTLSVTGTDTAQVPMTVIPTPAFGAPPLEVTLQAFAATTATTWQWDFEGDGTFDQEGTTATHSYAEGQYLTVARTKLEGRWVYGVAPIMVSSTGAVTDSSTQVGAPRAIAVLPTHALASHAGEAEEFSAHAIAVSEANAVKLFTAHLAPLATLNGLSDPTGVTADERGRLFVADTGHDRIVCFSADGTLDSTWADGGSFTGPDGDPLRKPRFLTYLPHDELLSDGGYGFDGTWEMTVYEASGRRLRFEGFDHWSASTEPRGAGVALDAVYLPLHPWGAPNDSFTWHSSGGHLFRGGITGFDEVTTAPQMRDFTAGGNASAPYWAVLDGQGTLHEWYLSRWHHRVTSLGFDAKVLALDVTATQALERTRRLADDPAGRTFGPAVLYLAGPGRIERRVVKPLSEGPLW